MAAAVVTLSVAGGPASAQTSTANPFQPRSTPTTAPAGAAASATSQSAGTSGTSGASSATSSSGAAVTATPSASASAPIPTTGVEAARTAVVGFACVALGLVLLVAARPRR